MTCELCTENHPKHCFSTPHFYVIDAGDDNFPAFLRVVARRHVTEMTLLTEEERQELMTVLLTIEALMRERLRCDKVNWAQFGCVVAHLHWHITARWKDDSFFPETPWGRAQRPVDQEKSHQRREAMMALIEELKAKFA